MEGTENRLLCRDVDELLLDYTRGMVDAETASAVRQHIRQCADCKKKLDELAAMTHLLHAAEPRQVQPPAHHKGDILRLAGNLAPVARAKAPSLAQRWGQWLAGCLQRPSMMPALSAAMCALLLIGVFVYTRTPSPVHGVPFRMTEDIGFPLHTRGETPSSVNEAESVWWFYLRAPAQMMSALQRQPNAKALAALFQWLQMHADAIVALNPADKRRSQIDATILSLAHGKSKQPLSLVFEKDLLDQLAEVPPEAPVVVCAGLLEGANSLELRLGRYDPWVHGDMEDARP